MTGTTFARMLGGGDRRSIGKSNVVVTRILQNPRRFRELLRCMWSEDPIVRMRATDAAEKVSKRHPELLRPFKPELLGLLKESTQQEVRWHLAQMIPRLDLSPAQRQRAAECLHGYLDDRSSIVKTFAIQALADISAGDTTLRSQVRATVLEQLQAGPPAMRARCRKLIKKLAER